MYMQYLIAVFPNWCLSQPHVWLCMRCDFCTPPVALLPAITLRVAFEIDSTLKEDNPAFLLVNELQQCHLHPHCCRALIRTGEPRCTSGHLHIVYTVLSRIDISLRSAVFNPIAECHWYDELDIQVVMCACSPDWSCDVSFMRANSVHLLPIRWHALGFVYNVWKCVIIRKP